MLQNKKDPNKSLISDINIPLILVIGSGLLIVYFLFNFASLRNVINSKDLVAFKHAEKLQEIEHLTVTAERKIANSRGYLMYGDQMMLKLMDDSRQEFYHILKTLKQKVENPDERQYLKVIEASENEHQAALENIIEQKKRGASLEQTQEEFQNILLPARMRLDEELKNFKNYQKKQLNKREDYSVKAARRATWLSLSLGLISLFIIPLLGLLLLRSFRKIVLLKKNAESSSERLTDILNNLDHSVVWEAEANPFKFSFVSQRSQFIVGHSGDEWINDTEAFFRLIPSSQRESLKETLRHSIATFEDKRISHQIKNTDGKILWVQTGMHPKKMPDGSIRIYGLTMDITSLKTIKEDFKKTQDQFNSIMSNAPFLIYMKDTEKKYIFCNQEALKTTNMSEEEVLGKTDIELFGEEIGKRMMERDEKVLAQDQSVQVEEVLNLNGKETRFFSIKFPIKNEDGKTYAICGISNDITSRKRAEEALRSSEERLALAMEGSGMGVWDWSLHKNTLIWNENSAKIFDYHHSNLEREFSDFESRVHLEDKKMVTESLALALEQGRKFKEEFRIVLPSGEIKSVLSIGHAIYDDYKKPCRMVGIISDITARKKAENELLESQQRLQSILDYSPSSIYLKDLGGKIVLANQQFAKIFKRPLKEILGKTNFDLVPFEVAEGFLLNDRKVIESKRALETEESGHFEDGYHTYITAKFPIFDSEGNIKYLGGISTDISDRKEFEKSLQEAVRVREEVLAIVSHDLRNPLGAMMVGASLIERKSPNDEFGLWVKDQAVRIHKAGQRMNTLIEDLLSLAKIEAGHFSLVKSPHLAAKIFDEAFEYAQTTAFDKNITVKRESDLGTSSIICDNFQIMRVFTNLISNAVKFSPQDGIITLRAEKLEFEIKFSISDTGPGIAEHHISNVFDRFWQAQGTAHKGTGLGLAIAKGIVESHRGRIEANSHFGEGATFSFTLPRDGEVTSSS